MIDELQSLTCWMPHDKIKRPTSKYNRPASIKDPNNWMTYDAVMKIAKPNKITGLPQAGLVLSPMLPYVVVDADTRETAGLIINKFASRTYLELSPGMLGVHVWFHDYDHLAGKENQKGKNLELFTSEAWHYVTVTGLGNDLKIADLTEEDAEWIRENL